MTAPIEERPVTGTCSRCRANVTFTRDEDYPDILSSACCGFAPLNLPEETDAQ